MDAAGRHKLIRNIVYTASTTDEKMNTMDKTKATQAFRTCQRSMSKADQQIVDHLRVLARGTHHYGYHIPMLVQMINLRIDTMISYVWQMGEFVHHINR